MSACVRSRTTLEKRLLIAHRTRHEPATAAADRRHGDVQRQHLDLGRRRVHGQVGHHLPEFAAGARGQRGIHPVGEFVEGQHALADGLLQQPDHLFALGISHPVVACVHPYQHRDETDP
jgi:hypothetical protein